MSLFPDSDPSFNHSSGRKRNITPSDERDGTIQKIPVPPGTSAETLNKMYQERGIPTQVDADARGTDRPIASFLIWLSSLNPFKKG